MLPYHVGVLEELVRAKVYQPGKTPTAGSSGGSYIAVATTAGTKPAKLKAEVNRLMQLIHQAQQACNSSSPDYNPSQCDLTQGLEPFQRALINSIVSNSSKKLKLLQNRAYTHITEVIGVPYEPYPNNASNDLCSLLPSKNMTVGKYLGRDDVMGALVASSFYSGFVSPNCTTIYRGKTVRDGGYSVHLPCPPKSKHCLRVEANLIPTFKNVTCPGGSAVPDWDPIDPDIFPGSSGQAYPQGLDTLCDWLAATTNPALIFAKLSEIYALAKADAQAWIAKNWK